jgi:nucleotide-binding universal stress UspA family protein
VKLSARWRRRFSAIHDFYSAAPGTRIALLNGEELMANTVLAAVDLRESSARVLFHAAGFAKLLSADLRVLYVTAEDKTAARQQVVDFCTREAAYEIDPETIEIVVRSGHVSEAIYREAADARLVVMGSGGRGDIAAMLLGSSAAAYLKSAQVPVLLVPPIDADIVSIADRPVLTCGPVLAAVDLTEPCDRQLQWAADVAGIAVQPLLLMTVAPHRLDEGEANLRLRERAHHITGRVRPYALIVRRGRIAQEISRCADVEGSGLVVMGLRHHGRGRPGVIASAVLKTKRAFVLAVPGC